MSTDKLLPPDVRDQTRSAADRLAELERAASQSVPAERPIVGEVRWGIFSAAPHGWLMCNGQSTQGYPALIAHLAGAGLASNVTPNLVDRVPVGAGGAYLVGAAGGAATHTLTVAQMPAHDHPGEDMGAGAQSFIIDGGSAANLTTGGGTQQTSPTTGPTGGGAAFPTMPPYVALTAIIRAL